MRLLEGNPGLSLCAKFRVIFSCSLLVICRFGVLDVNIALRRTVKGGCRDMRLARHTMTVMGKEKEGHKVGRAASPERKPTRRLHGRTTMCRFSRLPFSHFPITSFYQMRRRYDMARGNFPWKMDGGNGGSWQGCQGQRGGRDGIILFPPAKPLDWQEEGSSHPYPIAKCPDEMRCMPVPTCLCMCKISEPEPKPTARHLALLLAATPDLMRCARDGGWYAFTSYSHAGLVRRKVGGYLAVVQARLWACSFFFFFFFFSFSSFLLPLGAAGVLNVELVRA